MKIKLKYLFVSILSIIVMLSAFVACNNGNDNAEQSYEKVMVCIEANDFDEAIELCEDLTQDSINEGKNEILSAIKDKASWYLSNLSWLSNSSVGIIDEKVVEEFKKYDRLLKLIEVNDEDFTNVDSFVDSVLMLGKYIEWNDFYKYNGVEEYNEAMEYVENAKDYTSDTLKEYYWQLAYNRMFNAYNTAKNHQTSKGLKECADFYKTGVDALESLLKGGSGMRNQAYDNAYSAVINQYKEVLKTALDIIAEFPTKLY